MRFIVLSAVLGLSTLTMAALTPEQAEGSWLSQAIHRLLDNPTPPYYGPYPGYPSAGAYYPPPYAPPGIPTPYGTYPQYLPPSSQPGTPPAVVDPSYPYHPPYYRRW